MPRTGPLGDGSPLTEPDTQLTLQYLDNITSTLNLTQEEKEAYKALSLDGESLITVLESIRDDTESLGEVKTEVVDDHSLIGQSKKASNSTNKVHREGNKPSIESDSDKEFWMKEKSVLLERKSTSNDDYEPEDSMFDIMIRNNENLITALIGKPDGDANTNLLKTVNEGITNNGETIGEHIGGIKQGIDVFKQKLMAKFAALKLWSGVIATHVHGVVPAVPPSPVTAGGSTFPTVPIILAPVPRTGPLGDGTPLTPNDTILTINWVNKAAESLNMTEGEGDALKAMTLNIDDLEEFLVSVEEAVEVMEVGELAEHLGSHDDGHSHGSHEHRHEDGHTHATNPMKTKTLSKDVVLIEPTGKDKDKGIIVW